MDFEIDNNKIVASNRLAMTSNLGAMTYLLRQSYVIAIWMMIMVIVANLQNSVNPQEFVSGPVMSVNCQSSDQAWGSQKLQ